MLGLLRFFVKGKPFNAQADTIRVKPTKRFTGSAEEFLRMEDGLEGIERVDLYGKDLLKNSYNCDLKIAEPVLEALMEKINRYSIKSLSFDGCKLTPASGVIIGKALESNSRLKRIELCANQLGIKGVRAVLEGLKGNKSLTTLCLHGLSATKPYYWPRDELIRLAEFVQSNTTLEQIELQHNQLHDFADIALIMKPYLEDSKCARAKIVGLEVDKACKVPDCCYDNREELEALSICQFMKSFQ